MGSDGFKLRKVNTEKSMLTVLGELRNKTITFLLDSGASNNFLSKCDVANLGLELKKGTPSSVKLADGNKLKTSSYVEGVVLFGSFQAFLKFEVLDCDCVPILGYTFLQQTNP